MNIKTYNRQPAKRSIDLNPLYDFIIGVMATYGVLMIIIGG